VNFQGEKKGECAARPNPTSPLNTQEKGTCVVILPEAGPRHTDRVEVYDLRDAGACARACTDLDVWGRQWTEIHILDNDHVAIQFKPRGTLEAAS
jgi:hypothetical protein